MWQRVSLVGGMLLLGNIVWAQVPAVPPITASYSWLAPQYIEKVCLGATTRDVGFERTAAGVMAITLCDAGSTPAALQMSTLALPSGQYLNFGTPTGTSGYGLRDNAGVIEFKSVGGAWAPFSTTSNYWSRTGIVVTPTVAGDQMTVTGNVTFSGTGNTVGTITSGIWNAGAVTSSGAFINNFDNDNNYVASFTNTNATSGHSFGLFVRAGSTTGDSALYLRNHAGTPDPIFRVDGLGNTLVSGLLTVSGFGTHTFGNGTGTDGDEIVKLSNPSTGASARTLVQFTTGTVANYIIGYGSGNTGGFSASGGELAIYTAGTGGLSLVATHASGAIRFYTASGGIALRAQINANGTQTWAPYGAGAATFDASGNITSVSDARFKDRVSDLPYGLAEVLALRPVQHGYNELSGLEREHLYGGFLAQDVQSVMPLAVGMNPDGYLTLADRPILGATVNAIKTLNDRIEELEAHIAQLRIQIAELRRFR